MQHLPVRLHRGARRKVQRELRLANTERVDRAEGRLREIDKDNLTFTLRDTPDGIDVRGVLDEGQ